MITVPFQNKRIRIDGIINREDWTQDSYKLLLLGSGFCPARILVRSDNVQEAIDYLVDSDRWSHLILAEDECPHGPDNYDDCDCNFAGNYGKRIEFDDVSIYDIKPQDIRWFDTQSDY